MQRKIAFRAWDVIEKRWMDSTDYMVCNCGRIALRKSGALEYSCSNGGGNYTLMQFTGLKDKNGKEIYEGDIVRRLRYGDMQGRVVAWDADECGWNIKGYIDDYEIIGNVWENPDLLSDNLKSQ